MNGTFHAPGPRVAWLTDVITSSLANPDAPLRVLDIGCGAGDQLFALAPRLSRARLVGVDIADANVALANRQRMAHPQRERIEFRTADYRTLDAGETFDLVTSYSVLQFVPGGVEALAARIAQDTSPGGLFINVMPYRCAYNTALTLLRRALASVRSRSVDRVLLQLARMLHGSSWSDDLLEERIRYTYAVPEQFDDDLAAALQRLRFETVRHEPVPQASPAQMKHALRIMRRSL